jgi:NitT/TauT family transport system permease protein
MPRRGGQLPAIVAPIVGVAGFLLLWQLLVRVFDVQPFALPAPSTILGHIASDPAYYARNAATTMWEAFLGLLIGFAAGVLLAAVMARSRFTEHAITPVVVLIQVTPLIAYAPALVLWLGFGLKPILLGTALVCFVPFVFNAVTGFRSVDPAALELLRSVEAREREVFFRLRVPSSLPYLFSAARVAVGLSLIGAVLMEFFSGTQSGLGVSVRVAQDHFLTDQLWGSVFVLAFIGAVGTYLIGAAERVALRWHAVAGG